jgi:hypothetical protein
MKKLIAALIASLAFTAQALPKDSDIWSLVATDANNGDQYSIQNGSGMLSKNDNGVPVIAVLGRILSKDNVPHPLSWYVPLQNCDTGIGVLVIMTPTGDYLDKAPFAFKSGTIAGLVAEVMCGAAEKMIKNGVAPVPNPQQKKPASNGPSV